MAEPTPESASPIGEITHGPTPFERFLDRNQKSMILLGILLALGIGAWVVYSGMEEGKRLAAGQTLVAAEDSAAMQDVVKNHAGTPAAISAAVLLSDMQWDKGQQTAAIDTLKTEIAEHPEHPATPPARARLAARLLQQGEVESARSEFEALLDAPEAAYLAPYALLSLSEISRTAGKTEEARKLLETAAEDYPDNPLRGLVTQSVRYVDFEMPEAVDPPQEPAAPTEVPEPGPDLSQPIELDPTNPDGGQSTGNPLLDNLNQPTETPEVPASDPAEDTSDESSVDGAGSADPGPAVEDPEPTPDDAEESASGSGE